MAKKIRVGEKVKDKSGKTGFASQVFDFKDISSGLDSYQCDILIKDIGTRGLTPNEYFRVLVDYGSFLHWRECHELKVVESRDEW